MRARQSVADATVARIIDGRTFVGGDEVVLRQAEAGLDHNLDRYGRVVVFAYALRDGAELFT